MDFEIDGSTLARYHGDNPCVVVPDGITRIGTEAFAGCGLYWVMLPDTLTHIDDRAFYDSELEDIYIPDSVVCIGDRAFGYHIERFFFGEQKEKKDEGFWMCGRKGGLAERYATENGLLFEEREFHFDVEAGVLKDYRFERGLFRIPKGVIEIADGAFTNYHGWRPYSNEYIYAVVLPDGVRHIGDNAFEGCINLDYVSLPDSLTSIGYRAFYDCRNLKDVTIPASVTEIGRFAFGFYEERWEAWDIGQESDFTIHGEAGSAAECYAREYGFTFVPVITSTCKRT